MVSSIGPVTGIRSARSPAASLRALARRPPDRPHHLRGHQRRRSASAPPPARYRRPAGCAAPPARCPSSPASGKIRYTSKESVLVRAGLPITSAGMRLPVPDDGRVLVGDLALADPGPQFGRDVADRLGDRPGRPPSRPGSARSPARRRRPSSPARPTSRRPGRSRSAPAAAARAANSGRNRRRTGCSARSAGRCRSPRSPRRSCDCSRPVVICCCRISPRVTHHDRGQRQGQTDHPDQQRPAPERRSARGPGRERAQRADPAAGSSSVGRPRVSRLRCRQQRSGPVRAPRPRHGLRGGHDVPARYPTPRTVTTTSGCSGSFSILERRRWTWTLTSRVSAACR